MEQAPPGWWAALADRRRFLKGAGALLGATLASACGDAAPADEGGAANNGAANNSANNSTNNGANNNAANNGAGACPDPLGEVLASTPDGRLDPEGAGLPYRQDDPRWADDVMWDRELVLRAATELNGETREDAESLMREFEDGNTIGNEGCMLTCLAMVLRLLMPDVEEPWTPRLLNQLAHYFYYYTPSGLSLTTLYGDLVSDSSVGEVQLCLKEEYLPGQAPWPRVHAHTAPLVRAYRSLPPAKRADFLLMLKTGTYDDTVASHFALLHPHDEGGPDDDNPLLLDPAQPLDQREPWRLKDSAAWITTDPEIGQAWEEGGIEPTQVGGVWVFVRWSASRDRSLLAPLVLAWARELARPREG